jgi:Phosphotransferase enzyme family
MGRQPRRLHGGYLNESRIIKQANSVIRRQDHPWPQAVGEALAALERRGFHHCPRELQRLDANSVMLTYMPGRALPSPVPPWAASIRLLLRVTRFIHRFSLAAQGIKNELTHSDWLVPSMSDGDVLVHGDPHPTNLVFNRFRQPTAIIDFELATLGTHDWNLISLLFTWVPLEPLELTCWKHVPGLPVSERIATILEHWPSCGSVADLLETARTFIKWRQAWIAELARLGNPGATMFMHDRNFERRYQHAIYLLESSIG